MSFLAHCHTETEEVDEDISTEDRNSPGAFMDGFMIGPLNEAGQRLQDQKTQKRRRISNKNHHLSALKACPVISLVCQEFTSDFSFIIVYQTSSNSPGNVGQAILESMLT